MRKLAHAASLSLAGILTALAISSALAQSPVPEIKSQQAEPLPTAIPSYPEQQKLGPQTAQTSNGHSDQAVLDLPSIWTPTAAEPLPSPPPALAEVTIPDAFIGCWKGKPSDYDYTHVFYGYVTGSPGETEYCYSRNHVDIPRAEIAITAGRRLINLLSNLGLAYDTFTAHGIRTDVYGVSPTKLHCRTTLTVEDTIHQLDMIPVKGADKRCVVDWSAELVGKDDIAIRARLVQYYGATPMFVGAWHCNFRRMDANAD
jgi:hypothetical protein